MTPPACKPWPYPFLTLLAVLGACAPSTDELVADSPGGKADGVGVGEAVGAFDWSRVAPFADLLSSRPPSELRLSMDLDEDGNILVAGSFRDSMGFADTRSKYDGFVASYAANGDFLWGQQIGALDDADYVTGVAFRSDGYYVSDFVEEERFWRSEQGVAAYDSNHELLWKRVVSGKVLELVRSQDDGVLVLLHSPGFVSIGGDRVFPPPGSEYVVKLDQDGTTEWISSLGGGSTTISTVGDNLLIGGASRRHSWDGEELVAAELDVEHSPIAGMQVDGYVMAIDGQRKSRWLTRVPGRVLDVVSDGETVWAVGRFAGEIDIAGKHFSSTHRMPDIFVAEIDFETGSVRDVAMHHTPGSDVAMSVELASAGAVWILGHQKTAQASSTTDPIILKYSEFGELEVALVADHLSTAPSRGLDGLGSFMGAVSDSSGKLYGAGSYTGTFNFGNGSTRGRRGFVLFGLSEDSMD